MEIEPLPVEHHEYQPFKVDGKELFRISDSLMAQWGRPNPVELIELVELYVTEYKVKEKFEKEGKPKTLTSDDVPHNMNLQKYVENLKRLSELGGGTTK